MKNILLILVGGTICTALNGEGNLSVSKKSGAVIKENFINGDSPFAKKVNIELSENLFILSENMTVDKWNKIISTYREYSAKASYDGIIFAHGTDTLAFSAAFFAQLLSGTEIPVFFVSANEPLYSERSNGNDNFRSAVECICRSITPNVYVTYKNITDGKQYLHLASRITQCANYSEDFYSIGMTDISGITEENYREIFSEIANIYPAQKRNNEIDIKTVPDLKECILMIDPYVGLSYDAFNYSGFSAVLHGTYHSGTACAEDRTDKNSVLYMIDRCSEISPAVDIYFSPGEKKSGTYETVARIGNHTVSNKKMNFIYGFTKETAYAKLVIAYSVFDTVEERKNYTCTEQNFEKIY